MLVFLKYPDSTTKMESSFFLFSSFFSFSFFFKKKTTKTKKQPGLFVQMRGTQSEWLRRGLGDQAAAVQRRLLSAGGDRMEPGVVAWQLATLWLRPSAPDRLHGCLPSEFPLPAMGCLAPEGPAWGPCWFLPNCTQTSLWLQSESRRSLKPRLLAPAPAISGLGT